MAARRHSVPAALLIAASALGGTALAQQAVPPGATREEVLRQEIDRQLREGSQAIDSSAAFERSPCPLADEKFAGIRLTLSSVTFTGAENVEPGLLDEAWTPYRGREMPVAAICEIRDRAAALLRDNGYVASVQVPVQTIEGGAVRFDVTVARLVSFVVRGDAGNSGVMVERYLEPLRDNPVFDTHQAERALLLARRIPGVDVRMALARASGPDTRPGDLVGIVDVVNRPVEIDLAVQNYGSDEVGPWGVQARMRINGLTGLADQTELSAFVTPELREQLVVQGRHEFALGSGGLRVGASAIHAWTRPDVPGDDVFFARTLVATAYAQYPLMLHQSRQLDLRGAFELVDQTIDLSAARFSRDRLRVASLALEFGEADHESVIGGNGYSISEPRYSSRARIELRKGLGIFGASEGCGAQLVNCTGQGVVPISRLDADPRGFLVRGDAEVAFRPLRTVTLTARPRFQYSGDRLLPYEQFSGGNFTVGRGYDPGDATGDRGFGSQIELAFGSLEPRSPAGSAFQGFVFYDSFSAWFAGVPGVNSLNSAGGGVRVNFRRRAFAELIAAVPLETAPLATRKDDVRVLLNLAVRLGS